MISEKLNRTAQKITVVLPVILFACALYIVHTQLKTHSLGDILASLEKMPMRIVFAAFALTVINYLVLAGYDWLALRFAGYQQIPLPKMIAAAMLSYSISNNTGHAWAAGGSIRFRFYSKWGVLGWDILKISLFQTTTYLLGALSLGLLGSLILPQFLAHPSSEPQAIHWVSLICAATLMVYWAAVLLWRKPLMIKGFELFLPSPSMTLAQTVVSAIDIVLSSLVLWMLLLGKVDIGFGAFLVVFVVAQVVGVISQVPGGIVVFESAFLWLMSSIETADQHLLLIGALLLYRVIYYFVPLLLAGIGLLGYEVYSRRKMLSESGDKMKRTLSTVIPQLYSLLLLLAGGILLVSGFIPANSVAMAWLGGLVPLPVIELSHLTGSLIGLLLLFLARGIRLKIDAAWYGSLMLLGLGIVASLLKGFDWREASVLSMILLLMLPTRSHFQRRSSLLHMSFSKSWLATMAMVLAGSIWLGFFAYRDVGYAHELWWQFSYEGNAPRFLRAVLLIAVVTVSFGLSRLLSVAPPQLFTKPTAAELTEAQRLVEKCSQTRGFLALLGDKYLFWNLERDAFIMYAVTPPFWIAMGDPVGKTSAFENLLWQFVEQADRYGAKAVFYQVSPDFLPYYLDLDLSLFKFGEEACVDLSTFTLQGKRHDAQRSARNKFGKIGYVFEILFGKDVEAALPRLRQISDAWLANKNTREKGFSLGFFAEDYLRRTDVAVIQDESGQIMAFANLWQTIGHEELSIDLMRYDPESPKGIMDFLFAELMLWGKAEHYQWFSLGMAPLAGLERRPLAPLWHKIGAAIFDMGDQFYNFEGLYEYKAKFLPHWQPRYLAAPSGLGMPRALMAIARQISGGWQGIFSK
ncbi:MAG: bifunctional lysylphosphatidylglycerol flippase/synthetase MprF [Methylovulum sp.]|uniref:bifunctional lysylphosphatidylglycerol flippase/synthetase MprF n=1 Tax=Methylovulum sp. TaxID=1916980 RepID=UPI002629ECE3|nr:bifunctional lysylphosphatidylglycerol flippase/synthetase MprF [Methylovulum sp.]MDD2725638.1 bifunctional lysylphosphatidylglycerol flippase/synthetase MprF [Methylovulum sp.]